MSEQLPAATPQSLAEALADLDGAFVELIAELDEAVRQARELGDEKAGFTILMARGKVGLGHDRIRAIIDANKVQAL